MVDVTNVYFCTFHCGLTVKEDEVNKSTILVLENPGRVPELYNPFCPRKQGMPAATEIPAPDFYLNKDGCEQGDKLLYHTQQLSDGTLIFSRKYC
jgi:hypothetical protein